MTSQVKGVDDFVMSVVSSLLEKRDDRGLGSKNFKLV